MRKTVTRKNGILSVIAAVFAVVFLISAALTAVEIWNRGRSTYLTTKAEETVYEYDGRKYVQRNDLESFLIIGLDKFDKNEDTSAYNNDSAADFLLLAVIDNETGKTSALQINRDTMTMVNRLGVAGEKIDSVKEQIALAHTYGNGARTSCRNTVDAVSELLLGVKVDHYISFTMDSVAELCDLVGGVELEVLADFTGIDDTLVKGEVVTLTGEHALTYVRARKGMEDSSNVSRMERQRQYISALFAKTSERLESDDGFALELSEKLGEYITYDISESRLQGYIEKIGGYEFSDIKTLEGESIKGESFMEFYADYNSIMRTVTELFCESID